jgi:nicotinate-nucleotide pyrophosphorylase (carboxylating)
VNIQQLIESALDEDIGPGDLTSEACVPLARRGRAQVVAKQALTVCGQQVARSVFIAVAKRYGTEDIAYEILLEDGVDTEPGGVLAQLEGSSRVILVGERVALNLLMRLSGIATHVGAYVEAAGSEGPRVVDTRKTTALHRDLEKYAVRCGGGHNHRRGLYDGVMVKDNHIVAAGSIGEAVRRVRSACHHLVKIEVEVTGVSQIHEAIDVGADVLLLDNMDDDTLKRAVRVARKRRPGIVLEASGNMNPERIARIRGIGLDVVSAGGLIHQATWVDLSLQMVS